MSNEGGESIELGGDALGSTKPVESTAAAVGGGGEEGTEQHFPKEPRLYLTTLLVHGKFCYV